MPAQPPLRFARKLRQSATNMRAYSEAIQFSCRSLLVELFHASRLRVSILVPVKHDIVEPRYGCECPAEGGAVEDHIGIGHPQAAVTNIECRRIVSDGAVLHKNIAAAD